jgi:hypothetical protein
MPNMAFGVHDKRFMKDLIDERGESKGRANLWPIAAGAVAGALAGYVLSTPRGRHVLDEVIVMLDDFSSGCARFSQACARAQLSASEGWNTVTDGFTSKSMRYR